MPLQSDLVQPSDINATLESLLGAMVDCATAEQALRSNVVAITQLLGFDSFSYAVTTVDEAPPYGIATVTWTTLPAEWLTLYERMHYVSVDPRVINSSQRTTPYVWDAASGSVDCQAQPFLRDAARFGICSGVVVSLRDARQARAIIALNSQLSPVSERRRSGIQRALGDVMLFAVSFHEVFMQRARKPILGTRSSPVQLSFRERQCLQMAAHGMTSTDIGTKLGITPRTANFHFSNVISKMGVLNRHEAIARAVSTGLI